MKGADHYRESELILQSAKDADPDANPADVSLLLHFAQVHATLALAAAVGGLDAIEGPNGGSATGRTPEDSAGWVEALEGGAQTPDPYCECPSGEFGHYRCALHGEPA